MATLIVLRHGNTFEAGETPRRVGATTDLPLTAKGREQAANAARILQEKNLQPVCIYSSPLARTLETARIVSDSNSIAQINETEALREVDYGVDENKTEEDVIARIGEDAITAWEENATLPDGWQLDLAMVDACWQELAQQAIKQGTVLAVTSNGIARFALKLTGKPLAGGNLKLATGALGIFTYDEQTKLWHVAEWNLR